MKRVNQNQNKKGARFCEDRDCATSGNLEGAKKGATITMKEEPKGEGQGVVSLSIEN